MEQVDGCVCFALNLRCALLVEERLELRCANGHAKDHNTLLKHARSIGAPCNLHLNAELRLRRQAMRAVGEVIPGGVDAHALDRASSVGEEVLRKAHRRLDRGLWRGHREAVVREEPHDAIGVLRLNVGVKLLDLIVHSHAEVRSRRGQALANALIGVCEATLCPFLEEPRASSIRVEDAPTLVEGIEETRVVAEVRDFAEVLGDGGARHGRVGLLDVEDQHDLVEPVLDGGADAMHNDLRRALHADAELLRHEVGGERRAEAGHHLTHDDRQVTIATSDRAHRRDRRRGLLHRARFLPIGTSRAAIAAT